jgi:hypothetical protein
MSLRALVVGSFILVVAAGGLSAYPSGAADAVEWWNVGEYRAQLRTEERVDSELDRQCDEVTSRIFQREEWVRDLLAGRATFDEVAVRYAEMNRRSPDTRRYARMRFPGGTDEERAAWQLLGHVRSVGREAVAEQADAWECELVGRTNGPAVTGTAGAWPE